MFPFNLDGPQFLVFFVAFAAVVLVGYGLFVRALGSSGKAPRLNQLAANPYQIAYLRGGFNELGRVAVVNLVDRGLLVVHDRQIRRAREGSSEYVRQPIDKAILQCCPGLTEAEQVLKEPRVTRVEAEFAEGLQQSGLLLSENNLRAMALGHAGVVAMILAVAIGRIVLAFSRGHANVVFLVALTIFAVWVAGRISRGIISADGRQALGTLRALVNRGDAAKLRRGSGTTKTAVFASLYGIFVLPPKAFDFVQQIFFPMWRRHLNEGGELLFSLDSGGGGGDGGGCGGGCGGCGG